MLFFHSCASSLFSRQVRQHSAVDTFGFVLPILIDGTNRVVGGWALVLAAQRLGLTEIPVTTVADLSEL